MLISHGTTATVEPPPWHTELGHSLPALTPAWTFDSGDPNSSIVGQGDTGPVIVASGDNYSASSLYGLDPKTGKVEWKQDEAFYFNLLPTVGPFGNLYSPDYDADAVVIRDGGTGKEIRDLKQTFSLNTRCAVGHDGTIFVGGSNSPNDSASEALYAIDPVSGKEKWHFPTQTWLLAAAPTVGADNHVYCTTLDGKVFALDADTGKLAWTFAPETPIGQSVVLGPTQGTVYAVDYHDTVYALNPQESDKQGHGVVRWTNALKTPINNPYNLPNLDVSEPLETSPDGHLYVIAGGTSIRSIDRSTGAQAWEQPLATYQAPVFQKDGKLLVYDEHDRILSLDPATGTPVAEWSQADGPARSPIQAERPVVSNFEPGKVVALPA